MQASVRSPRFFSQRPRAPTRLFAAPAPAPAKEKVTVRGISLFFEPFYRVVLVYNDWDSDKPVAQKVKQSVPVITARDAMNVVRKTRLNGRSIVVTVLKDDAVTYINNLKNKGLSAELDEA